MVRIYSLSRINLFKPNHLTNFFNKKTNQKYDENGYLNWMSHKHVNNSCNEEKLMSIMNSNINKKSQEYVKKINQNIFLSNEQIKKLNEEEINWLNKMSNNLAYKN